LLTPKVQTTPRGGEKASWGWEQQQKVTDATTRGKKQQRELFQKEPGG